MVIIILLLVGMGMLWVGIKFGDGIESSVSSMWSKVMPTSMTGDGGEQGSTTQPESSNDFYTCGMHPWVILPTPGLCPICQMDLTPIDPSKFTGEVTIDPIVVQNIGVRIRPVVTGPVTRTIRTVGTVDYDETRGLPKSTTLNAYGEKAVESWVIR